VKTITLKSEGGNAMSCHDIGRGMASVAKVVISLYESKQIDKQAVIRLIHACRKGVHWCDGNEGEAMEPVVEAGYCGLCFEKKKNLSSAFDNDLGYPKMYDVFEAYDDTAANDVLCPECKERILAEYRAKKSRKERSLQSES
jgi:hypothetical protein